MNGAVHLSSSCYLTVLFYETNVHRSPSLPHHLSKWWWWGWNCEHFVFMASVTPLMMLCIYYRLLVDNGGKHGWHRRLLKYTMTTFLHSLGVIIRNTGRVASFTTLLLYHYDCIKWQNLKADGPSTVLGIHCIIHKINPTENLWEIMAKEWKEKTETNIYSKCTEGVGEHRTTIRHLLIPGGLFLTTAATSETGWRGLDSILGQHALCIILRILIKIMWNVFLVSLWVRVHQRYQGDKNTLHPLTVYQTLH